MNIDMKHKIFCLLIGFILLFVCGCSNVEITADDKNNNSKKSSSDVIVSFSTAQEERDYWLYKYDYPPEYNSSSEIVQTFTAIIDNKTYLEFFEVIIHHDVSLKGYEFTVEDFKGVENIDCVGISGKVMNEEKYKQNNSQDYEEYYNNYHQYITIYPKEKTIEKVEQMVSQLKELPFVQDIAFYQKGSGIDCMG
ncbi:MAG: hypothetical protein E7551_02450 [Ruminococcaceae bacterium]|nr:hypothetical protein [Oscillospiraceae bacterium]